VRVPTRRVTSSGEAFQSLNLALLRSAAAPWLQFCAPDVGHTTHLGPVIRQTGVFAPRDLPDTYAFLREAQQTGFDFHPSATGQFHALGIAEGNAMMWAYAFGRRRLRGEGRTPLLPVVTVYDKFFERALNQLDYAVYAGARFVAVGVPSGSGLSRETATHQSLQTPRIMMDLPGIVAYEPAFAADVEAVYLHALGQLWAESGEAVYLRLSTQPLEQPVALPPDHAVSAVRGAWWLIGDDDRRASEGPNVVLVASGRMLGEVRRAARELAETHGVGSRILNVTSYERLWRDWDAFARDPTAWADPQRSYALADLFDDASLNRPLIIVGDHVASVAEWLPGALQRVRGHRFLGPRGNGMAGDVASLDRFHGMAVEDIVEAALAELAWRRA
jgi:pyruvate dehydrogenase E1 component